jgi:hypothetical protein
VSRISKKTFYLKFCMGTPEGHQKSIFNTPKSEKKTKTHVGSIRQSLQAQPKNLKKLSKHLNQPIHVKKISNKSMFSTSKVKRRLKFEWGLPDRVCRLNPEFLKKIIRTPTLPIRTKILQKKVCLSTSKIRMGATRQSLQAQPKILRKSSKHQI